MNGGRAARRRASWQLVSIGQVRLSSHTMTRRLTEHARHDVETTRPELIARLAEWAAGIRLPHPIRVAVDGVDAAGKSTLATELVEPLTRLGRHVIRASIDGFHRPRSERYQRGELSPQGYYSDSFDYEALKLHLLRPLGPRGSLRYRAAVFDHRSDMAVSQPSQLAPANAILLFDGIFLMRPEIDPYWDARVYVRVPLQIAMERGVERDSGQGTAAPQLRHRYETRYAPAQRFYLETVRPEQTADAVVDNSTLTAPGLFLKQALSGS